MTSPTRVQFVVTAYIENHGNFDTTFMLDGIQQGLAIARQEGLLTAIDDESTIVHGLAVRQVQNVAEVVVHLLGESVNDTPQTLEAVTEALSIIGADFNTNRITLLTEPERELLITAIGAARENDEANEPGFVRQAVKYGHRPLQDAKDLLLIEMAFVSTLCIDHLTTDQFVEVLDLLAAKPEVVQAILAFNDPEAPGRLVESVKFYVDNAGAEKQRIAQPLVDTIESIIESAGQERDAQELLSPSPAM